MSDELKACPFCNIAPELVSLVTPVRYFYHCPNCGIGAETQGFDRNEARNLWNTRPLEDALQARITELEAENARLKSEIVSKDKKVTDYEIRVNDMLYANKRLRHALEVIADSNGHHDHSLTYAQLIEYAKDALDFVSTEQAISTSVEIKELLSELASLREQVRWRKYPDEKPEQNKWYWTDYGCFCEYVFDRWEDINHAEAPVRFYIDLLVSLDSPPLPPEAE